MTRLSLLAVLTCVIVVACERVPLTSPTGSTISVTIDQGTLPLNGQAQVRAIVIESAGTPVHNGTQVSFSTTLGNFNPPSATTVNGVATSTFFAGSISGTTKINAYSGGASTGSGNSSGGGVEVKIGAAAASGNISVSATPSSVSQSGGSVTISAIVFDESSNPLPGVQVQFVASTGALSATTAITDANGIARTTLSTTQTATVTAFAGSAKGDVQVAVSSAPTVTISDLSPSNPAARQPVAFTVTLSGNGSGAPRQVQTLEVNFGDGARDTRSNVTGSVGFTHTYQQAGGYTITATATDVSNNTGVASKSIVVGFAAQPTVTLTASPNPVSLNASQNGVSIFTLTATAGASGVPIRDVRVTAQDGTVVYQNSGPVSAVTIPQKFRDTGTFTYRAIATDANGETATASTVIFVTP